MCVVFQLSLCCTWLRPDVLPKFPGSLACLGLNNVTYVLVKKTFTCCNSFECIIRAGGLFVFCLFLKVLCSHLVQAAGTEYRTEQIVFLHTSSLFILLWFLTMLWIDGVRFFALLFSFYFILYILLFYFILSFCVLCCFHLLVALHYLVTAKTAGPHFVVLAQEIDCLTMWSMFK